MCRCDGIGRRAGLKCAMFLDNIIYGGNEAQPVGKKLLV